MKRILLSGVPELFLLGGAFILGNGGQVFSVFLAALLHEAGHMLAAFILGVRLRILKHGMAGLSLKYDMSLTSHTRETIICLSGPAVGIAVALSLRPSGLYSDFAGANAALALFNLLPVSCLDGGGALRAILSMLLPPDTVWKICRALSLALTLLLWCLSVYILLQINGNISVATVSIYLLYRLFSEI